MTAAIDKEQLADACERACDWLVDVAQVKTDGLGDDTQDSMDYNYQSWKGAIRSEYAVAEKKWTFLGPCWHTGQAVKALLLAASHFGNDKYLQGAQAGADFITDKQIWDEADVDHGLILAYERCSDQVNVAGVIECMEGLMMLAERREDEELWQRMVQAGRCVIEKMYMPQEGVFRDIYDPAAQSWATNVFRTKDDIGGRPLLDDAVLVKLYEKTGEREFLDVHIRVSQRLVADQNPPGNWIDYGPCDADIGSFHPRQAYWWGLPLLDTYRQTGGDEFLQTAIASGEFCIRGLRADGGWIRGLYMDNNTDSFGHATSGAACAAILLIALFQETRDEKWLPSAERAIDFCTRMQFTATDDPNLRGAILETVRPPDGTDRLPYHIRDLGTIFFVIAAVKYLQL